MVIKMSIRKVERRFIDVRNPDHTIKKFKKEDYPEKPQVEEHIPDGPDKYPDLVKCNRCNGKGTIKIRTENKYPDIEEEICPQCNGTGIINEYRRHNPYSDDEDEDDWKFARK